VQAKPCRWFFKWARPPTASAFGGPCPHSPIRALFASSCHPGRSAMMTARVQTDHPRCRGSCVWNRRVIRTFISPKVPANLRITLVKATRAESDEAPTSSPVRALYHNQDIAAEHRTLTNIGGCGVRCRKSKRAGRCGRLVSGASLRIFSRARARGMNSIRFRLPRITSSNSRGTADTG
jgi:hypothetical protein